jgi:hypothetical protein
VVPWQICRSARLGSLSWKTAFLYVEQMSDTDAWLVSPPRVAPPPPPSQDKAAERAEELLRTGKWSRAVDHNTGADFFFDVSKPLLRTWNLAGWVEHQLVLQEAMSGSEQPAPASPEHGGTWRERIVDLYSKYNPSKLLVVDELLARYEGREQELWRNLMSKYGMADGTPTRSSPIGGTPRPTPSPTKASPKFSSPTHVAGPAGSPGEPMELFDTSSLKELREDPQIGGEPTECAPAPSPDPASQPSGSRPSPQSQPEGETAAETPSPSRYAPRVERSVSPRQAAELKARALLTKVGGPQDTPLKRTQGRSVTPKRASPTASRLSPSSARRGTSPTSGRRGIPTEDPSWAADLDRRAAAVVARREEVAARRREARAAREAQVAARAEKMQRTKSHTPSPSASTPTPEKPRPKTPSRVVRERVSLIERQSEAAASLRARNTAERPASEDFDPSCSAAAPVGWKGKHPID